MVRSAVVVLVILVSLHASGGMACASEEHGTMTYAGTVGLNLFYIPGKAVFASLGALTSGLAYVFTGGNSEISNSIWNSAVEGDYVLRPEVIEGKERVRFFGS